MEAITIVLVLHKNFSCSVTEWAEIFGGIKRFRWGIRKGSSTVICLKNALMVMLLMRKVNGMGTITKLTCSRLTN